MKKLFIIFISILALIFVRDAYALAPTSPTPSPTITPSTTPTPTGGNILNEINSLKDRIASKVAQLNLVEKRGMIGTVTDIGGTQLTLNDRDGNIQFVDVDELTKFSSPSAGSTFGISDITKGSTVGILGQYNKDSKRILARFVDVLMLPKIISGAVSNIDTKNYQITIIAPDLKEYTVSIQDITKTTAYTKAAGIARSGFSKIQQGERVFVIGFPDKSDSSIILATRIIRLPELKSNPLIPQNKLQPSQDTGITPSTGSGLKLVPILTK